MNNNCSQLNISIFPSIHLSMHDPIYLPFSSAVYISMQHIYSCVYLVIPCARHRYWVLLISDMLSRRPPWQVLTSMVWLTWLPNWSPLRGFAEATALMSYAFEEAGPCFDDDRGGPIGQSTGTKFRSLTPDACYLNAS